MIRDGQVRQLCQNPNPLSLAQGTGRAIPHAAISNDGIGVKSRGVATAVQGCLPVES